jgi:hypothetical protein
VWLSLVQHILAHVDATENLSVNLSQNFKKAKTRLVCIITSKSAAIISKNPL